jgi:hypothetical protein
VKPLAAVLLGAALAGCAASFADDWARARRRADVVLLSDREGFARVLVGPDRGGAVLTSTAGGPGGRSFGWLDGNLWPGEDRPALEPEGPFVLAEREAARVRLRRAGELDVERTVRLLSEEDAWRAAGATARPNVRVVAYETDTRVRPGRAGTLPAQLVVTGRFRALPGAWIVAPAREGRAALEVGADSPREARGGAAGRAGLYDPQAGVLTVLRFGPRSGAAGEASVRLAAGPGPDEPYAEIASETAADRRGLRHVRQVLHFVGPEGDLARLLRETLDVAREDLPSVRAE